MNSLQPAQKRQFLDSLQIRSKMSRHSFVVISSKNSMTLFPATNLTEQNKSISLQNSADSGGQRNYLISCQSGDKTKNSTLASPRLRCSSRGQRLHPTLYTTACMPPWIGATVSTRDHPGMGLAPGAL